LKKKTSISLEDIWRITVSRDKLEQWLDVPYWGTAIRNVYVRIGVSDKKGRIYKLAEIVDDKETNQAYKVGTKDTNKELVLKIGKKNQKFFYEIYFKQSNK